VTESTLNSTEICFATDHPTAAGHFPGNPIIPGAVLLDTVLLAIADAASAAPCAISTVKFLRPVRPGDRIRIEWEPKGAETHFRCVLSATGDIAVRGTLRLRDIP
jgi:3-hydroxymyristoyl/3-hydroxydecanoyl-(acyl carrier protein) dehydratase